MTTVSAFTSSSRSAIIVAPFAPQLISLWSPACSVRIAVMRSMIARPAGELRTKYVPVFMLCAASRLRISEGSRPKTLADKETMSAIVTDWFVMSTSPSVITAPPPGVSAREVAATRSNALNHPQSWPSSSLLPYSWRPQSRRLMNSSVPGLAVERFFHSRSETLRCLWTAQQGLTRRDQVYSVHVTSSVGRLAGNPVVKDRACFSAVKEGSVHGGDGDDAPGRRKAGFAHWQRSGNAKEEKDGEAAGRRPKAESSNNCIFVCICPLPARAVVAPAVSAVTPGDARDPHHPCSSRLSEAHGTHLGSRGSSAPSASQVKRGPGRRRLSDGGEAQSAERGQAACAKRRVGPRYKELAAQCAQSHRRSLSTQRRRAAAANSGCHGLRDRDDTDACCANRGARTVRKTHRAAAKIRLHDNVRSLRYRNRRWRRAARAGSSASGWQPPPQPGASCRRG